MKRLLLAALLACGAAPALAGGLPAGTPVLTLTGAVPVEKVRPGDRVLAYSNEKLLQVEVRDIEKKRTRLLEAKTSRGSLKAAPEHPVLTRFDFTEMRALKKGDDVAVFEDGRRVWARVRAVKTAGVAEVYNLAVDPPHTFIAGGFVVHNYYSSYRRRRSYGPFDLVVFGIAAIIVFLKNQFRRTSYGRGGTYGSSYGNGGSYGGSGAAYSPRSAYRPAAAVVGGRLQDSAIVPRAQATLGILQALGARDPDFNPDELAAFARKLFTKFKAAQQARDFYPVRGQLMPGILASHSGKAESLRVRGEVNMIEDLKVLDVDFMHVRCPREKEGRSFTVLISYVAKDYTVRESTNIGYRGVPEPATRLQVAGGSLEPQNFQEYWTFNQLNGSWALARIDQPGEMDFINAPNLPDTPQAAASFPLAAGAAAALAAAAEPRDHSAYMPPGSAPSPALPPAPQKPAAALPPAEARPAPAPEGDHWNRQKMEIAATLAFESIYEAWGRNDSALLTGEYVSAEALVKLKAVMDARKAEGLTFEFKSLFPRRAEIVLTSPAVRSKLHLDEFTARITATAVRSMSRNGKVLHRDEAPEPFTEYWVFGRQDKAWKLRDILPRMDHEADRSQDGAPGPAQIEWYWRS